jgi:hypothetical protein
LDPPDLGVRGKYGRATRRFRQIGVNLEKFRVGHKPAGVTGYYLCDFSERGKIPMRRRTSAGTP